MEIREEGSGQDFNQDARCQENAMDKDATGRWLAPTPQPLLWDSYLIYLFSIEGQLLCSIGFVSVIYQRELTIGVHVSLPS